MSAHPSTVDLSPAAERRLESDEQEREWMQAPILAAIGRLGEALAEVKGHMAQGFSDLHEQVQAIGGEGGQFEQLRDLISQAFTTLQGQVATAQQAATDAQAALTGLSQTVEAAGLAASEDAAILRSAQAKMDGVQQSLTDMVAAVNPPATDAGGLA